MSWQKDLKKLADSQPNNPLFKDYHQMKNNYKQMKNGYNQMKNLGCFSVIVLIVSVLGILFYVF